MYLNLLLILKISEDQIKWNSLFAKADILKHVGTYLNVFFIYFIWQYLYQ